MARLCQSRSTGMGDQEERALVLRVLAVFSIAYHPGFWGIALKLGHFLSPLRTKYFADAPVCCPQKHGSWQEWR
jgi:hypothetical protein